MTQPPDDAALVARLRDYAHNGCRSWLSIEQVFFQAATALEAKDRRIAEMRHALNEVARISGERVVIDQARAALEPSDKVVGISGA